jgi:hypothetical protein
MEKRSRRRTRDLVTQAASQGLSENEIGWARISMILDPDGNWIELSRRASIVGSLS